MAEQEAFAPFDSLEITFDSTEITWDSCHHAKGQQLKKEGVITGGLDLVLTTQDEFHREMRLDMFPDTHISLKILNPMFQEMGSHTTPFTLPTSKNNLVAFGFPNRVEGYFASRQQAYPIRIFHQGIQILTGTLTITSSDKSNIECYFKSGNGNFWSDIREKSLKDIALGKSPVYPQMYDRYIFASQSLWSKYPQYPFACYPIINEKLAEDTGIEGIYQDKKVINHFYHDLQTLEQGVEGAIIPQLYVAYILERLFATFGYSVEENVFVTHPELSTLTLYNSYTYFTAFVADPPAQFDYANHVQDYPITDFLNVLEVMFGTKLYVNDLTKTIRFVFIRDLLTRPSGRLLKKITSSITLETVPGYDSMEFNFNGDDVVMEEDAIKDIDNHPMDPPVMYLADLPNPTTIFSTRYVITEDRYYIAMKSQAPPLVNWELYSYNLRKGATQPGQNPWKIECPGFTLPIYLGYDNFYTAAPYWDVAHWPLAAHPGVGNFSFAPEKEGKHSFTPRFLFYRGMQSGAPLATWDVYDKKPVPVQPHLPVKIPEATIALQWEGAFGIKENFYREYIHWMLSGHDKLEFNAYLNIVEIAQLDFTQSYALEGNIPLLIESVEVSLSPTVMTASKIVGHRI